MQAILWETPVSIGTGNIGGVLHYFTEQAQAMIIDASGNLETSLIDATEGQWGTPGTPFDVDINTTFVNIRFDHPVFGIVYGALSGGSLHLLVYIYAADISSWVTEGKMTLQEKAVHSMNLSVSNVDIEYFNTDTSLFSPGNIITVKFTWGDNVDWISMYEWYIDSVPYSEFNNAIKVQCRTILGLWLKDVTFDDDNSYSGQFATVVKDILLDGATILSAADVIVQTDATSIEVEFKPSDKRLNALEKYLDASEWKIRQLPNGKVIIGDAAFINTYDPNTKYSFTRNNDVFTRKISRNVDAAYSKVCAYAGNFVRTAYYDVSTFIGWTLPNKTYYEKAPAGSHSDGDMTQAELNAYVQSLATKLQYAGVTETLYGPMRPELLVGDLAQIYDAEIASYVVTGIITGVKHSFGIKGYETTFTSDSGGTSSDVGDTVESDFAIINGANRERRITDFIRNDVSESVIKSSSSAGSASPLTTKGDLFGFGSANARIPVGLNEQVLAADSSQALGVKWTARAIIYNLPKTSGTIIWRKIVTITEISAASLSGCVLYIAGEGDYENTVGMSYLRCTLRPTISLDIYEILPQGSANTTYGYTVTGSSPNRIMDVWVKEESWNFGIQITELFRAALSNNITEVGLLDEVTIEPSGISYVTPKTMTWT